jgi:hypothetical protein
MKSDYYHHPVPGGPAVSIRRSAGDAGRWDLWLEDTLICGGFPNAEEAAFKVNRRELPDYAKTLLVGIWVPPEIHSWVEGPPKLRQPEPPAPVRSTCPPRPWKPAGFTNRS